MKETEVQKLDDAFWVRTVFVVLFYCVFRILDVVLLMLVVAQWFYQLFTGRLHKTLLRFSSALGVYAKQIIDFVSHNSSSKPYPFSDWPNSSDDQE